MGRAPFVVPSLLVALLAGCGGAESAGADPATEPVPDSEPTAPTHSPSSDDQLSLPAEDPEGLAIVERMSEWCSGHDDCDASERPDAHPNRVAAGETNGYLQTHRELAEEHGVTPVWDAGRMRYVSQVEHDVALIVGGRFSPDHLGPSRYEAILGRARTSAPLYLGVLVDRVLRRDPSWLSATHVPHLLSLLRAQAPDEVRAVAAALLSVYRDAIADSDPPPADDEHRLVRLRERAAALERLSR